MDDTMRSCREFTAVLSSAAPAPGGGGAAALTAAVGTALCGMVANLTTGKKAYSAVESDIQQLLSTTNALQEKLLDQVAADAEGFLPLAAVYALPKDAPPIGSVLTAFAHGAVRGCAGRCGASGGHRLPSGGVRCRVRRRHSGRSIAGGVPERAGEYQGHGRGGRTADGAVPCPAGQGRSGV